MAETKLQEIVTKAVVGRAERRVTWSHTHQAEGVTGVLGVHVTDCTVALKGDGPTVELSVDCDLWCTGPKNTKVMRCTCKNSEAIEMRTWGKVLGDRDWKVTLLGDAEAVDVQVNDGKIALKLQANLAVEMSALTRLWVKSYDLEEEYDDLEEASDVSSDSRSGSSYSGSESDS